MQKPSGLLAQAGFLFFLVSCSVSVIAPTPEVVRIRLSGTKRSFRQESSGVVRSRAVKNADELAQTPQFPLEAGGAGRTWHVSTST